MKVPPKKREAYFCLLLLHFRLLCSEEIAYLELSHFLGMGGKREMKSEGERGTPPRRR